MSSRSSSGTQKQPEDDVEKSQKLPSKEQDVSQPQYPPLGAVIPIFLALWTSMFLVALDRTIISTAIPRITDTFYSISHIGWYGSAYMLTSSSSTLLFGRLYTFHSPKILLMSSIVLFEVGSALCGAAPTSIAFIIGRAIAGLGSAGIWAGAMVVFIHLLPLKKRPVVQGVSGALFGIAAVVGPLLGGAFTELSKAGWRWCFWINLVLGGPTIIILIFALKLPENSVLRDADANWKRKLMRLDPPGAAVFLPGMVCLLLALQWGGSTYAWSSWRLILLLVLAGVLLICFVLIQWRFPSTATVPPHIIAQRSVAAATAYMFLLSASMMTQVYFLPLYFQSIHGASAVRSGIMTLPLLFSVVIFAIIGGGLVQRTGYYTPNMYFAVLMMSLGAGLITRFDTSTPSSQWIGYQVVYGVGLGAGMQQAGMAVQTVLRKRDQPTGLSIVFFVQALGGAVGVAVGNSVLVQKLADGLQGVAGLEADSVVRAGATELRDVVGKEVLGLVLERYSEALKGTFWAAVAWAVAMVVPAACVEWRNLKTVREEQMGSVGGTDSEK